MNASFEEKSVWIQLVSMVGILGLYFVVVGFMLSRGVKVLAAFVPLFTVTVALMVIVMVASHIVVSIVHRPDKRDERDRLIEWRAESNSSWVLGAGVMIAIIGMIASVGNVWIAHFLLLCMFLSEVAKYTFQLVYYRRGM